MASDRQIAANRENAKKSTGPRSDEGKRASRINAIDNGLYCSLSVLRQLEDADSLATLHDEFRRDSRPHGAIQEALVEQLASIHHRLRRFAVKETLIDSDHMTRAGNFEQAAARDYNVSHDALPKISTAMARLHREFRQTLRALREEQASEPAWLDESLADREARGDYKKTNPIEWGPEDLPPDSSPNDPPKTTPPPSSTPPRSVADFIK